MNSENLMKSKIYQILKEKCSLQSDKSYANVISLINNVVDETCELSKKIIIHMPEYTLHDETHLFRILTIMERIIPSETLSKLSIPELMVLILSAFLHDIGMAPPEEKVKVWKKIWKTEEPTDEELYESAQFQRFRDTYPHKISEIERLQKNDQNAKATLIEDYLISEYIRSTHEERAREYIATNWADKLIFKDKNLSYEVSKLCFSHGQNALSLLDLETNVLCDEDSFICLPFIGVILRLSDLLDFDAKRTPSVLFSHLAVKNPVSLKEWQKHRSVQSWIIKPDKIAYHAKCSHPAIEKSIYDFCDQIDKELLNCSNVLTRINDDFRDDMNHYKITFPAKVDRTKILPDIDLLTDKPIYIYKDTSFELSKNQIIDLLMGTKLYDDTKSALRELIQNSIDACLVAESLCNALEISYNPEIIVRYYSRNGSDFLEVEDNGIGMNQEIIEKFYSNVGSSYYKSKDFYDLKSKMNMDFEPISRFGIGILSCFMVSDTIEVNTRRLLETGDKDDPYNISIEGYDSIFMIKSGKQVKHGTLTKLSLRKKQNPWDKIRSNKFIKYVKESIPNPPVPIRIETNNKSDEHFEITKESFSEIKADSLKYYYWEEEDYINEIEIDLSNPEKGILGNAIIAILENENLPITNISDLSKTIKIEDEEYLLESKILLNNNEIEKIGTVIEVDVDSGITTNDNKNTIKKSKSRFSIHGINYPAGIFPDVNDRNKKAKLRWPIPMLLVIDITGTNDIDLNSSRTEIIFNKKWADFEKTLAEEILLAIKKKTNNEYWKKLLDILSKMNGSEIFNDVLNTLLLSH